MPRTKRRGTFGRNQIAAELDHRFHLGHNTALGLVDTVFISVMEAMRDGRDVTISNFASFTIRHQDARTKRDPRTGDTVHVPDKNVVKFVPSRMLKATINGG